jgi:asparagine synthase (glutamine-hydrolysing)
VNSLVRPLLRAVAWGGSQFAGPRFENFRRGLEMASSLSDQSMLYGVLRNAWDTDSRLLTTVYNPSAVKLMQARTQDILAPQFSRDLSLVDNALWTEFQGKMVDDFLHNEDRVSMAHSLETRVPFLDRELAQTAWKLPLRTRFGGGIGKRILRSAMADVLPERVLQKPKWGFTFSSYHQFRKDLRPIAQQLLQAGTLDRLGLFNETFIRSILDHRPSPLMRWHYFLLWMIVGLHFWCELFLDGRSPQEISESQARVAA